MYLIFLIKFNTHILYFYIDVLNKYNFCNFLIPFKYGTYLIEAREQFKILKNGSVYQGAWPPMLYKITFLERLSVVLLFHLEIMIAVCYRVLILNEQLEILK